MMTNNQIPVDNVNQGGLPNPSAQGNEPELAVPTVLAELKNMMVQLETKFDDQEQGSRSMA